MIQVADIDAFQTELRITYRGETYLARDNGAVLRRASEGRRVRPLDETWTFGNPCASTGYMTLADHKVHRIVATGFHGEEPSRRHVVDHIDTNRRNNRPENLRWVTRLENVLLNPITAKRIEHLYGSIEAFLANPREPQRGTVTRDFEWMRAVTPDEAEASLARMTAWARAETPPGGGGSLGDWVFRRRTDASGSGAAGTRQAPYEQPRTEPELVASRTPGAAQRFWRVPVAFPLCPKPSEPDSLSVYAARLEPGAVAIVSPWGETVVNPTATSADGTEIYLLGDMGEEAVKRWSLARITLENGSLVHESHGTFFSHEGAENDFMELRGPPRTTEDSIDDYC
ncbi:HNH endonuclease signature motif containing protein [Jannaschia formosa]|uniref:HNH endonuclease signature motif containing protein n=1 Tax=Jannaschia formosa TaxID=2259592 RepID=UPI000E1B6D01|nr:HNH endonuclease signature motif containing protein [Jannaschia formosa]TFL16630.1 HNH endonuclease [Jannaschia formosa]